MWHNWWYTVLYFSIGEHAWVTIHLIDHQHSQTDKTFKVVLHRCEFFWGAFELMHRIWNIWIGNIFSGKYIVNYCHPLFLSLEKNVGMNNWPVFFHFSKRCWHQQTKDFFLGFILYPTRISYDASLYSMLIGLLEKTSELISYV